MLTIRSLKLTSLTISKMATVLVASNAFARTLPPEQSGAVRHPASLSEKQRQIRLKHAHELLGRYYKKSSVNVTETIPKINSAIYHWTREHLPSKYRGQSGKVAQAIIDESTKQGFDPVFLMSVIEGESSWRPDKVGSVGEIGLMQLRPATGKWMASKAGIKWSGDQSLYDPRTNIKLGAAYLGYLRDRFDDHARLYLAAYNMGQTNVDAALEKKVWPKDYPIHVMKLYVAFYEKYAPGKQLATPDKIVVVAAKKKKDDLKIVMKPASKASRLKTHEPSEPVVIADIDRLTKADDDVNDSKVQSFGFEGSPTTDDSATPDQPDQS